MRKYSSLSLSSSSTASLPTPPLNPMPSDDEESLSTISTVFSYKDIVLNNNYRGYIKLSHSKYQPVQPSLNNENDNTPLSFKNPSDSDSSTSTFSNERNQQYL